MVVLNNLSRGGALIARDFWLFFYGKTQLCVLVRVLSFPYYNVYYMIHSDTQLGPPSMF